MIDIHPRLIIHSTMPPLEIVCCPQPTVIASIEMTQMIWWTHVACRRVGPNLYAKRAQVLVLSCEQPPIPHYEKDF